MIAKLPKRGQKCKKICHHKLHMIVYPPTLIRADFVFLHFAFLPFITETVSLKGESQSIIIWLNLISHHHLDEMDFLGNECAKSFAKKVDLVIHQAKQEFITNDPSLVRCVMFWLTILISQKDFALIADLKLIHIMCGIQSTSSIRQRCRLTICMKLVELTNSIRWQDPNNNTDAEARCLV